jgi:hypothetical protein
VLCENIVQHLPQQQHQVLQSLVWLGCSHTDRRQPRTSQQHPGRALITVHRLTLLVLDANILLSDRHTLLMVKAGDQPPLLPSYRMSKQMWPLLYMWGWMGLGSKKMTSGASSG